MQLEEFYGYKNLLMKSLCENEQVVKLVTGNKKARVPNHGLPYSQIFPYEFVPDTVDEGKTFVCFDVDIVSVPNKTYYTPVIYVWVFTHKSLLRMKDGNGCLLDQLCMSINEMINGSRYFGLGETKLDSVRRFAPIKDYLGRCMTYYTLDFNRAKDHNWNGPSNRKRNQRGE